MLLHSEPVGRAAQSSEQTLQQAQHKDVSKKCTLEMGYNTQPAEQAQASALGLMEKLWDAKMIHKTDSKKMTHIVIDYIQTGKTSVQGLRQTNSSIFNRIIQLFNRGMSWIFNTLKLLF